MTETTSRRSTHSRLLDRTVRILVMHNHSGQELWRKLAAPVMGKNGPEEADTTSEDYDKVIAWCIESRYLDDDRFVQQFIANRSRKGYGPARIRQELNRKGIACEAIERAVREYEIDWAVFTREQATRKYGGPLPVDFSDKIKVQRFLLYRGYLMEDIQTIWRSSDD